MMLDSKMRILAGVLALLPAAAAEPQWPFGGSQASPPKDWNAPVANPFQPGENPFAQAPQQAPQQLPQAAAPAGKSSNPFAAPFKASGPKAGGQQASAGQPKNPFSPSSFNNPFMPNAKAGGNPSSFNNPFMPNAKAGAKSAPKAAPASGGNPFAASNPFGNPLGPSKPGQQPAAVPQQPAAAIQQAAAAIQQPAAAAAAVPAAAPIAAQAKPAVQQDQNPTATKPNEDSLWTPPAEWGPKGGRQPFGPKPPVGAGQPASPLITPGPVSPAEGGPGGGLPAPLVLSKKPDYCNNPDVICTTTVEGPQEPLPYKVTCGRTLYMQDDVSNALKTGCYYVRLNKKIGGSGDFPREFTNVGNRFDFGPYIRGRLWEMPLFGSAAYAGGPPGPDRVIFSMPDCFLGGVLTTTSNGQFSECTEEY